jgi:hypothetical protein
MANDYHMGQCNSRKIVLTAVWRVHYRKAKSRSKAIKTEDIKTTRIKKIFPLRKKQGLVLEEIQI